MPKIREIAVVLMSMRAYPQANKVTTRHVVENLHRVFGSLKVIDWKEIEKTSKMLRHMNHNGLVSKERDPEKQNQNLWWLTKTGKDYAKWCYDKMRGEGKI